ncbi:LysR substrate-binding domain-containing protein [Peribacillus simplex]|uniref:LysR substrate-binding domain-containing protein n=1 Tax=Peribacillus simplex TaxID=1478 RepID=UPI0035CCE97B
MYSEPRCSYKSVFVEYSQSEYERNRKFRVSKYRSTKTIVKSGLGISLVPYFSDEDLESNKLKVEIIPQHHSSISKYLTYHKDNWLSPSIIRMFELIQYHAENW